VTRSNVTHPAASPPLTYHPAQSVMDCGGKAQRRHRFRPRHTLPITPCAAVRTICHYLRKCPYFARIDRISHVIFNKLPGPTKSNPVKPCLLGWRQPVATTFPLPGVQRKRPSRYPIRHSLFVISPQRALCLRPWPKNLCSTRAARPMFGSVAQRRVQPSPSQSNHAFVIHPAVQVTTEPLNLDAWRKLILRYYR